MNPPLDDNQADESSAGSSGPADDIRSITVEEFQARFRERGLEFDADDPIFAVHVANEIFVDRIATLLDDREARHKQVIESIVDHASERIEGALAVIKDETLKSSLEGTRASVLEQARSSASANERLLVSITRLRTQLFIAAALGWLALAFTMFATK